MRSLKVAIGILMVFALTDGRNAFAQEPKREVSMEYGWLDDHGYHFPVGWILSAGDYVTPWLAIVGEAGGQYHYDRVPNLPGYTYANQRYNVNLHSFTGGIRVTSDRRAKLSAFGQVLAGSDRMAGVPLEAFDWRQWSFLLQPGIGGSVRVSRRTAARATVDFPAIRQEVFVDRGGDDWGYEHRFSHLTRIGVGIAVGF